MTQQHAKITFVGSVNESTDFSKLEGEEQDKIDVNCKGINAINSFGIRQWLKTFKQLRSVGKKLTFIEISPVLVRQLSFVEGLISHDEIDSFGAEFVCQKCDIHAVKYFKPDEFKKMNNKLPVFQCPQCQKAMEFDDIPEEYFSFLK